ncbi:hypothetical protein D3C77_782270 [compost metagenome]
MASASDCASRTGTSSPVWPGSMASRQPGTSVVTTARPHAAASINDFGKPSRYEGRTAIWLAA